MSGGGRYRFNHEGAPSGDELARVNAEITRVMADVVRHDRRDPHQRPGMTPGSGPPLVETRGTGWVDPAPLGPPVGEELIGRMVDRALPPSPEQILANARLTPEQRAELRARVAGDPEKAWIVELLDRQEAKGGAG